MNLQPPPPRPPYYIGNDRYEMMAEAARTVRTELSLVFADDEHLSDTDSDAELDFNLENHIKRISDEITPEELEDEVLTLRSFLEYFYSKKIFPFSNPNTALDFVSSGTTMSLSEFKINTQKLKNRYKKRLWKICKNSQLLENAREQHAFELGNRLWGSMSVEMMKVNQEDQQEDDKLMALADDILTFASADDTMASADETLTFASAEEENNDKEKEEHGGGDEKDDDNKKGDGKDFDNKVDEKENGDNKDGDVGESSVLNNQFWVEVQKKPLDDKKDGDNKDGVVAECPRLKNEFWFLNGVLKIPVVSKEDVEDSLLSSGEERVKKNWEKRWKELEIEELNKFLSKLNTIRHYAIDLKDELQAYTYPHGEAKNGR